MARWSRCRATWRAGQAARIASTSGKYLYSVARPMPVSAAIRDIVTDASPCSATSAAVVSSVASCTARRCSSIVSVHSFGTTPAYITSLYRQNDLTATECLAKTVRYPSPRARATEQDPHMADQPRRPGTSDDTDTG